MLRSGLSMMTSDGPGRPIFINNFWKALANYPATLKRVWSTGKEVMAPGEIDAVTKEMIYIAVSVANACEYCVHSIPARLSARA